ncbi:hypothetical protein [Mesorhizobium sp. L48C026A00]|uniref:hypothetical protein n=1 Tax=Mesorhizobium sp. L48C026A00 TaxID=1287182 RepID=UPI0012EC2561|nr:hypothetical protein [Mesorhizobium sp. L48C026A00]
MTIPSLPSPCELVEATRFFLAGCFQPSHAVHTLTETICNSIKVCNSGQGQPQIVLHKFGGSTLPCCDAHPGITTNHPVWTHFSKNNNINPVFYYNSALYFTKLQRDISQARGTKSDAPKISLKKALNFSRLPIICHERAIKGQNLRRIGLLFNQCMTRLFQALNELCVAMQHFFGIVRQTIRSTYGVYA